MIRILHHDGVVCSLALRSAVCTHIGLVVSTSRYLWVTDGVDAESHRNSVHSSDQGAAFATFLSTWSARHFLFWFQYFSLHNNFLGDETNIAFRGTKEYCSGDLAVYMNARIILE